MHSQEEKIRKTIAHLIQEQGRKKTIFAQFLGYKGQTATKIRSIDNIINGRKSITLPLLNNIAKFFFVPVGYFITNDPNSSLSFLDDNTIIQNIKILFLLESKDKKIGWKKYQLGELLGGGGDNTAKIQTVNRILQKKKKITITELEIIAHFFKKPLEWFFWVEHQDT